MLQNYFFYFSIFVGLSLIGQSIYDYYNDSIFEGLEITFLILILWLVSLIISIVYLFFKSANTKIKIYSISVNILSFMIALNFSTIISYTPFKNYKLPQNISPEELQKSKFIEFSPDSTYFITLFFRDSKMSFGSGNNILGLYLNTNEIIDERIYGVFPIKFLSWESDTIKLKVEAPNGDSTYSTWYLNNWLGKNKIIGDFTIVYKKYFNY